LKNAKSSAEKLEKCSAQELFSAFGVSDQVTMLEQGKAVESEGNHSAQTQSKVMIKEDPIDHGKHQRPG
jgi:hypothetical protein